MMAIPKVNIQTSTKAHDCDCCGVFFDEFAHIVFDDGNEFSFDADGHFGGGTWSGDHEDLLVFVAMYLGINLYNTYSKTNMTPRFSESKMQELHPFIAEKKLLDNIIISNEVEDGPTDDDFKMIGSYQSEKLGEVKFINEYKTNESKEQNWDGSTQQLIEKALSHYIEISWN